MAANELSATYASPGVRWGLFLLDYPQGTYRFTLATGAELDPPVPPEFGGDGQFVVAVIDKADGTPLVTGYKDVPTRVERWQGSGTNRTKAMVDFKPDPDAWQVLCTKALGRALKRAGYPDDTKDLKAILLWRQRLLELEALRKGIVLTPPPTPPELGTGPHLDDLEAAGGVDLHGDRDTDPEDANAHEDLDVAAVDVTKIKWEDDAWKLIEDAGITDEPEDTALLQEIYQLAAARGISVGAPDDKKKPILLAIIEAKLKTRGPAADAAKAS